MITLLILNLLATVAAFGMLAARLATVEETSQAARDEVAGLAADKDSGDQLTLECDALHAKLDILSKQLPTPRKRRVKPAAVPVTQ
jgi:hypothetical protein